MCETLVEFTPKPYKAMTEKKLMEGLKKKAGEGGTVTEDMVIEVVKEITSKSFVDIALQSLGFLKTPK